MIDLKPTLIMIDTPYEELLPSRSRSREPSPCSRVEDGIEDAENQEEEVYGLRLLRRIVQESFLRNLSKLVVPVPVVNFPPNRSESTGTANAETNNSLLRPRSLRRSRSGNRRMLKK